MAVGAATRNGATRNRLMNSSAKQSSNENTDSTAQCTIKFTSVSLEKQAVAY